MCRRRPVLFDGAEYRLELAHVDDRNRDAPTTALYTAGYRTILRVVMTFGVTCSVPWCHCVWRIMTSCCRSSAMTTHTTCTPRPSSSPSGRRLTGTMITTTSRALPAHGSNEERGETCRSAQCRRSRLCRKLSCRFSRVSQALFGEYCAGRSILLGILNYLVLY